MSDVLLTPSKTSHSYLMVPVKPVKADLLTQLKDTIYVPIATTQTYGSVKIGDGLNVDNGVISFDKSEVTILSISLNGEILSIDNDKNVNIALSKNDVGLDQVDNTSDKDKPISNTQQEALNRKLDKQQPLSEVGKFLYVSDNGDIDYKNVDTIEVKLNDEIIDTDAGIFNFSNNFTVTSIEGGQVDIDLSEEFKESVGKIDSISLNGVPQTIDENKNVDLVIPIDDKLNKSNADRDILTNQTISINGDNVSLVNSYINLNSLVTKTQSNIFSLANDNQAGLMSVSDYKSIRDLQARVGQLEQKATRLLYDEKLYPTAEEINTFVTSLGYTAPFEGIAVVVSGTNHIWHYYEGDVGWKDDGVDVVSQFTNDIAGIIKGAAIDGKVYAETDGTGSVYGWNSLNTRVSNIENDLEGIDFTNFVDLTSEQTISGIKEFSNVIKSTRRRWVSDTSEFLITSDSFDFGFDNLLIDTIQTQTGAFSGEFSSGNIVYGDFIIPLKDLRDNVLIGREMTISDTSNSSRYNIVIGNLSNYSTSRDPSVYGSRNIVISTQQNNGQDSVVSGEASIAIGYNTRITGDNSIQLGTGTNNTSNTFQVWNYTLLDGSTGKIPSDRLAINLDDYATISDLSNYLNKSSTSTDGTSTITLSNSDGQLTISVNVDNYQKYYKYIQKNNVIETFNSGTTSLPKVGNVLGDGLVASQLALSDGTSYMQGCVNEMNNAFIGAIDYSSEELFLLVGKFSESTPISSILSNPGIYGISSDIYFGNMNNSYLSIMNDNVIISSNAYLDSVSDNNKIPKMSDIPDIDVSLYVPKSVTTTVGDNVTSTIDNNDFSVGITLNVDGYDFYDGVTTGYFGTNIISLGAQSSSSKAGFNINNSKTVFSKPLYNLRDSNWTGTASVPSVTDDDMVVIKSDLSAYTPTVNLAAVALSNSYNDLDDKPVIPEGVTLYTTTGQNTDGAMTQKATTDALDLKFDKTGGTITGDTNIVNGQGLVLTPASAGSTYYAFKFYAQGDDVFVEKQKVEGGADYQKLLPLDSSLSITSENAVQNRVVSSVINTIQETLNNKTTVNINNVPQSTINFDSDPQTQINSKSSIKTQTFTSISDLQTFILSFEDVTKIINLSLTPSMDIKPAIYSIHINSEGVDYSGMITRVLDSGNTYTNFSIETDTTITLHFSLSTYSCQLLMNSLRLTGSSANASGFAGGYGDLYHFEITIPDNIGTWTVTYYE